MQVSVCVRFFVCREGYGCPCRLDESLWYVIRSRRQTLGIISYTISIYVYHLIIGLNVIVWDNNWFILLCWHFCNARSDLYVCDCDNVWMYDFIWIFVLNVFLRIHKWYVLINIGETGIASLFHLTISATITYSIKLPS